MMNQTMDEYELQLERYKKLHRLVVWHEHEGAFALSQALREDQRKIREAIPDFEWRYDSWLKAKYGDKCDEHRT